MYAQRSFSLPLFVPPFSQVHTRSFDAIGAAIALDLRRLDGEQAAEHLQYIRAYLPESFFKKEADPMRFLLLIRRCVFVLRPLRSSVPY